ncbi:MAG: SAM-dependent methyltransferase [Gammaproteobacteria bacterium]|nr:SAM-dependent methyltransferase [Gammaproteobacteria bacterium]
MGVIKKPYNLPAVEGPALANSKEVTRLLTEAIRRHGGRITFDRFMDIAMFAPGRGYYDSINHIFGDSGDFTTAPELSPFFGRCIARQIMQVMAEQGQTSILEFGAGSGILAQTILMELEKFNQLPQTYYIYDISPSLRKRQFTRLNNAIPNLIDRLVWLNDMPESFNGVILANEVLDAMPVHKVLFRQSPPHAETFVTLKDNRLVLEDGPLSISALHDEMYKIVQLCPDIHAGYHSEVNLGLKPWIARVSQMLGQGLVLLIDYGFTRREYYQAINHQGNLMCYFQHRAHDDPLLYPGIQDVTCHVDFSLVANTFREQGLQVAGYTNQGFFLAGCGLEEMYSELDSSDEEAFIRHTRCLEQLILPGAMGETFKVIALSKGISGPLIGFSVVDEQDKL